MLSISAQTLHAALYRSKYILLTWSCLGTLQGILVCYCECVSPSVPVTAVSWMLLVSTQALHAALYRSIYSLLTWSCLGTLQGFLVCYCECSSPSVPVTAVSWMLSISTQALHATLYRFIYSLLTCSCLGTMQGFLVCYCNVAVHLFQLLPSAECCQFQHSHFMLHCTDPYTVCWLGPV